MLLYLCCNSTSQIAFINRYAACVFIESGRVADLRISTLSSTSVIIHWSHPVHSNGPIDFYLIRYLLTAVGDCPSLDPPARLSRPLNVYSSEQQALVDDLLPYSHYQVKVWPRTSAGRGQVAVGYGSTAAEGLSVCLSVCLFSVNLSVCLFVCFFICLSVHPSICVSVCSSSLHLSELELQSAADKDAVTSNFSRIYVIFQDKML